MGGGIFDIKNLKNHNDKDKDTLMLPGINDHKYNTALQLTDFAETLEPKGYQKIKKNAKSNVIIDKETRIRGEN
jgi:hypothetical protein